MAVIVNARFLFPRPRDFDLAPPALDTGGFKRAYWIYMIAIALVGAGYADFPLIAYHFGQSAVVSPPLIPILYALAMASDAASSLVLGVAVRSSGTRRSHRRPISRCGGGSAGIPRRRECCGYRHDLVGHRRGNA